MTVGEKIKQRRIELNMSQEELGAKVGYKSRSSIQKIEASRDLPLKKVYKMAVALDLPVSYLMSWEDTIPDDIMNLSTKDDEIRKKALLFAYIFEKMSQDEKNKFNQMCELMFPNYFTE